MGAGELPRDQPQNLIQGATTVAGSVTDAFRAQPGLLFLTIVNMAFLVFTYFLALMARDAMSQQMTQMHERYSGAIRTINTCVEFAFAQHDEIVRQRGEKPPADPLSGRKGDRLPMGGL